MAETDNALTHALQETKGENRKRKKEEKKDNMAITKEEKKEAKKKEDVTRFIAKN